MLTVKKHYELLTKQNLIPCYLSTHPNHRTVTNNPIPRRIKTGPHYYKQVITHLITTIANSRSVREVQNSLHQLTATN